MCSPVTDRRERLVDKEGNRSTRRTPTVEVCDPNTAPQRAKAYRELNGLSKTTKIPVDAVTASGSGSTPTSRSRTPGSRRKRVADARGLPVGEGEQLIDDHTDGRPLGILGEKTVNVLDLNLALDNSGQ